MLLGLLKKKEGMFIPSNPMDLDDATGEKLAEFVEKIEENEDVTNVFTAADSSEGE